MKSNVLAVVLLAFPLPLLAAGMSCDDLKAKIEGQLQSKGVQDFTLTVVDAAQAGDAKVIGSCESGSKKITYSRGGAGGGSSAASASSAAAEPAASASAEPAEKPAAKHAAKADGKKKLVPEDAPPGIWPPPK